MLSTLALISLLTPLNPPAPANFFDFKATDIDGKPVPLKKFKGKVVLVVNVASKCGNTPQYADLEKLYKDYKSKGLVVVGFPANNFGAQEPGTNAEIKEFCTKTYDVTFPMMGKISVKGDDESPIYKWLISSSDRPNDDIEWNFAKFIVGRDGKVYKRVMPKEKVDEPQVRTAIEAALAAK